MMRFFFVVIVVPLFPLFYFFILFGGGSYKGREQIQRVGDISEIFVHEVKFIRSQQKVFKLK